jgi:two-component system, NtrC family, nitrogen regulation sensor histidine kinase NtrY
MGYRHFRLICAVRIVGLAATIGLFFFVLAYTDLRAGPILLGLVVVLQTWELFRFVDTSNRNVSHFLDSLEYSDLTQTYAEHLRGGTHDELHRRFNRILSAFRRSGVEKQESLRYLEAVIQHSGVGLLAFCPDGTVELANNALRRMLGLNYIKQIEDLARLGDSMVDTIIHLDPGESRVQKIQREGEMLLLSLSATGFKIGGKNIKLVSVKNITSELVERETEAWQQLVRVLTHEIMNSVTPIASLASTARDMIESGGDNNDGLVLRGEALDDLQTAVATIEIRSEGLMRFVNTYRNLTKVPEPNLRIVSVSELLQRIRQLALSHPDAGDTRIELAVEPESLELTADPDLVEQVLINVVTNALQALKERADGVVRLTSRLNEKGQVVIQVTDNGPGIAEKAIDTVFVPFYTTKRSGTGIGLTLSRRIMRQHNGELTATSIPDRATVFTLRF